MAYPRIMFEKGDYYITRAQSFKGFEVYKYFNHIAAVRCASIGFTGQIGLDRAKAEIERRIASN